MKKKPLNKILINTLIAIILFSFLSGCISNNNESFIGKWKITEQYNTPTNPNITITWEYFKNNTIEAITADPFENITTWMKYELVGDELHTTVTKYNVSFNFKYKFSDDGNTLYFISLDEEDQSYYHMVQERIK